jgi:3-oxoacyl-[acyl-carrier-protein] synthase III
MTSFRTVVLSFFLCQWHSIAAFSAAQARQAKPRKYAFQSPKESRRTQFIFNERSSPLATSTSLSASSGLIKCRALGIGSAAPKTVITNMDLESLVETNDEWIRTRTGISSRHILQHTNEFGASGTMVNVKPESLRSLSCEAAKKALEMAKIDPQDLDLVICATSSAEDMFGDATVIASELGCSTSTVAFDLTAACSGFLFGAVTAGKFIAHGSKENQKALIIGADALSRWVDWDDRNTCILFGDGAGAMVLETCNDEKDAGILGYAAHSNGNGYGDLNCG